MNTFTPTCNMQHATCNMQHATCNMQHATCNMQHATCNMQHATCNKNGNKLVSFLAALALTAAALATPSAFGYGAVSQATTSTFGYTVNIATNQADANAAAINNCVDGDEARRPGCAGNISSFTNMCFGLFRDNDANQAELWVVLATTRVLSEVEDPFCQFSGCVKIDLSSENVCDQTCDITDEDADMRFPVVDTANEAGCRPGMNQNECDMTPDLPMYDSEDGGCRARIAMDCDSLPATPILDSEDGECRERRDTDCADDQRVNDNNICETVVCEGNLTREGRECVCVGDFEPVGESCFRKCESPETRVGNTDVCEDMTEMPPEPPEFTIGVGGETDLTTTESDRHEVAFADVSAIQITVATTVAGFMYTKTGGSEQLTVGLTDGVVGFNTTVSAGDYEITVTADNNTVAATISLYLTVAEEIMLSTTPPTATPTSSGGGGGGSAAGIIGGVVVVALALWYFTSGSDDLTWTPSYAFANHNGNMSYSVGSRWTATANDWQIYWQTRQTDKFVYGSGMSYNGDILSATMNSESEGKKTAVDVDLSANKTVGLWNLGGGYNFDMQLSETETDTKNRINAKVRYTMDKWILSANANTDGDTGTARINYSYRF